MTENDTRGFSGGLPAETSSPSVSLVIPCVCRVINVHIPLLSGLCSVVDRIIRNCGAEVGSLPELASVHAVICTAPLFLAYQLQATLPVSHQRVHFCPHTRMATPKSFGSLWVLLIRGAQLVISILMMSLSAYTLSDETDWKHVQYTVGAVFITRAKTF